MRIEVEGFLGFIILFQKLTYFHDTIMIKDIRKEKKNTIKADENNNIGFIARVHRNSGHPRRDS